MKKTRLEDNVILKIKEITKKFLRILALDKVDFNLSKGEVHALVGDNGAGKSTFSWESRSGVKREEAIQRAKSHQWY